MKDHFALPCAMAVACLAAGLVVAAEDLPDRVQQCDRLIDAMVSRNAAPRLVGRPPHVRPVFGDGFSWDDQRRVLDAIAAVDRDVDGVMLRRLAERFDDTRYVVTAEFNGIADNLDVGWMCDRIVETHLECAFEDIVHADVSVPDDFDLAHWLRSRAGGSLVELQMDACRDTIRQLPNATVMVDPAMRKRVPLSKSEQVEAIARVERRVADLAQTREPVHASFRFPFEPWRVFDSLYAKAGRDPSDRETRLPVPGGNETLSNAHQSLLPELMVDLGNGVTLEMLLVPPGEFTMGSPSSEDNQKPPHRVRITRPFYLGKHEVTQEQWTAITGSNPSTVQGAKYPVESISWMDCQEFLRQLNARVAASERGFRLPTEAEWEYACRAGTTTRYGFGDDVQRLSEYAWYDGSSGLSIQPVGQKKPNLWGLYDMHGNAAEWCADWYSDQYYAQSPTDNPQGAARGKKRITRGGRANTSAYSCESAFRGAGLPENRGYATGFRLARDGERQVVRPTIERKGG